MIIMAFLVLLPHSRECNTIDLCYLDHTGSSLYPNAYISQTMKDLCDNVYSNPHSLSTSSRHCSDSLDQIRYKVLQHFKTDVNEYSVIFTSGATSTLKLVAESFRLSNNGSQDSCGDFVYMEDNHTSVLGMRDVLAERGAEVHCLPHNETLDLFLRHRNNRKTGSSQSVNSLFVYSAQCNFSGVKYPLSWIDKIHNGALDKITIKKANWFCLLDAATYVSTNELNLNEVKPDFVCVSFYKLLGYPTGLGALLVRNTSGRVLSKKYYGGGTVLIALSSQMWHVPRPFLHEQFEDGTVNFLSIIALEHGFNTLYKLVRSMKRVEKHCFSLAKYAFHSLLNLHHSNGSPAVHLYADTPYDDILTQGNIVNFNMLRPNGEFIGFAEVLNMANLHGIQLRTGCFCNPGACRRHLELTIEEVKGQYESGHVCGDEMDLVNGKPTGSVRISFGYYTKKEHVDKFIEMLENCFMSKSAIRTEPHLWPLRGEHLKNKFMIIKDSHSKRTPFIKLWGNQTEVSNSHDKTKETEDPVEKSFISNIFLYPVKSCGRFTVSQWELDSKGLRYDREWMITNSSGVALTQKRETKMCLIRPEIDLKSRKLMLNCDGYESISVDLDQGNSNKGEMALELSLCQSKVCGDMIQGTDCGNEVGDWLSMVLGVDGLRLVRQLPEDARINKKSALSLSNVGQYLLVNESSVNWLSEQLEDTADCPKESMLHRFRCNFVVSGLHQPFVEQKWAEVRIGKVDFKVDGPCGRCQMICINQDTGEKTKEPLTTLSASFHGKLKFGVYLSKENCDSSCVSIGDQVIIKQIN